MPREHKLRPIKNAEWWLNHSVVTLSGLYTAAKQAEVTNAMVSIQGTGTANPVVETKAGDEALLKIQCMVRPGSKVAVKLAPYEEGEDGEVYEVNLPEEVGDLLPADIAYISARIDAISKPMSAREQKNFLDGVKGRAGTR